MSDGGMQTSPRRCGDGLRWPSMAFYGLPWPSMAFYGLLWPSMAFYQGLLIPSYAQSEG
eukprot:CAMPEP_0174720888 /NCGR_PEP_ID=MMETSP1094-20130205/34780_1 /TAXON_ID=156173 /ORGANISM="Chrysochromulina brevifilum, Strain UTEX LB 985" /LENGTH=58 /DNA_ID=CAMNT_0015921467 /DNA_START=115 /DNA_END=291 /DNA_ORIENTATION=-